MSVQFSNFITLQYSHGPHNISYPAYMCKCFFFYWLPALIGSYEINTNGGDLWRVTGRLFRSVLPLKCLYFFFTKLYLILFFSGSIPFTAHESPSLLRSLAGPNYSEYSQSSTLWLQDCIYTNAILSNCFTRYWLTTQSLFLLWCDCPGPWGPRLSPKSICNKLGLRKPAVFLA